MKKITEGLIGAARQLNNISIEIHHLNKNWWVDIETGKPLDRNVGELLMLVTSELSEALEGHRKNKMDEHLTQRKNFEVEIADALIRLFDISGGLRLDISGAVLEKLEFNTKRDDHKIENRLKDNGKKY